MQDAISQHLMSETAQVVDPQGENDEISLMCGLVGWALRQGDDFKGWDRETIQEAIRWNWEDSPQFADEMIERYASMPDWVFDGYA